VLSDRRARARSGYWDSACRPKQAAREPRTLEERQDDSRSTRPASSKPPSHDAARGTWREQRDEVERRLLRARRRSFRPKSTAENERGRCGRQRGDAQPVADPLPGFVALAVGEQAFQTRFVGDIGLVRELAIERFVRRLDLEAQVDAGAHRDDAHRAEHDAGDSQRTGAFHLRRGGRDDHGHGLVRALAGQRLVDLLDQSLRALDVLRRFVGADAHVFVEPDARLLELPVLLEAAALVIDVGGIARLGVELPEDRNALRNVAGGACRKRRRRPLVLAGGRIVGMRDPTDCDGRDDERDRRKHAAHEAATQYQSRFYWKHTFQRAC